jgi:nicotinamidase-related amidase
VPQTALIVVDMLNSYDHEDAELLAACVRERLPQIVDLRDEAQRRDDVLLVYVNDNRDAWDAGPEALVEHALSGEHPELVEPIAPPHPVPFLSKGRHSIFYQTALDHLLRLENASCSPAKPPSSASSTPRSTPTSAATSSPFHPTPSPTSTSTSPRPRWR